MEQLVKHTKQLNVIMYQSYCCILNQDSGFLINEKSNSETVPPGERGALWGHGQITKDLKKDHMIHMIFL